MIDMAKKKRGRPPKKVAPPPEVSTEAAVITEEVEAVTATPKEGQRFVFKSKYIRDVVTLIKPKNTPYPDGTRLVEAGKKAEFEHNTWPTGDPVLAKILRDKIEDRKDTDPYHIVETTQVE